MWVCSKATVRAYAGARRSGGTEKRTTLNIATNADSLGTWFVTAASNFAKDSQYLLNIVVDDQDHTAEWLRRGRVIAAVTSLDKRVPGCKRVALGALRYHATPSPAFMSRYFAEGVTPDAIGDARALTFNQKDRLQSRWLIQTFGRDLPHPTTGVLRPRVLSRRASSAWVGA
jgi:LysR family transcriptional regulator (chromosome initiation inhibitor)